MATATPDLAFVEDRFKGASPTEQRALRGHGSMFWLTHGTAPVLCMASDLASRFDDQELAARVRRM